MRLLPPLDFKKWVEDNRHLLKPPLGSRYIYEPSDDFIILVVGGPNARNDYHFNESEEFFYQIEGDILLKVMLDGQPADIPIKEGEMFLLPPRVPHSPRRPAGTLGIVVQKIRSDEETDGIVWFCESCGNKLHDEYFHVDDIVEQLPPVLERFHDSELYRTCKRCGAVMALPDEQSAG
jgi:3-hydroxyanthranilate 3,4-dioxygenase